MAINSPSGGEGAVLGPVWGERSSLPTLQARGEQGTSFLPVLPAQTQPLPSPWLPALSACLAPEEIT